MTDAKSPHCGGEVVFSGLVTPYSKETTAHYERFAYVCWRCGAEYIEPVKKCPKPIGEVRDAG